MNFFFVLLCLVKATVVVEAHDKSLRGLQNQGGLDVNPRPLTEPCTLLNRVVNNGGGNEESYWDCEVPSANGISTMVVKIEGINVENYGQNLVSGETTLYAPGITIARDRAHVPSNANPVFGRSRGSRRLAATGNRKVLVLRIIATGDNPNAETTASASTVSDKVFGTGTDLVNLKSQYSSCSDRQLDIVPASSADGNGIVNGVMTVTIPNSVSEGDITITNAAINQAATNLGFSLNSQFQHVMVCLPPGTMTGLAYAYINGWRTVYNDNWCLKVSVQMHEIGHNLNLAHSNEGGTEYADQTGMMGYSYNLDEGPKMCFNPAKIWQLGWYPEYQTVFDPATTSSFTVDLFGLADITSTNIGTAMKMYVKVPNGSGAFYIGFNRKAGINQGTQEAGDQITIVSKAVGDTAYGPTSLKAKLSAGGSFTFIAGLDSVTLTVNSITLSMSPAVARITLGDPITSSPTLPPTSLPTSSSQPSSVPTQIPSPNPSTTPSKSPTSVPSVTPSKRPTKSPSGTPTLAPSKSSTPSAVPTKAPTKAPSLAPSKLPTDIPSMPPSKTPTKSPTKAPTPLPTTCKLRDDSCTLRSDCCSGKCRGNNLCL